MEKHKAPTQITIASVQERTFLHELVERYWKLAVGFALLATAAILVPHYTRQRASLTTSEKWDRLRAETDLGSPLFGQVQAGSPAALANLASEFKGEAIGAWATALEAGSHAESGDIAAAERTAARLESEWPDHLLAHEKLFPGPDGAPIALPKAIQERRRSFEAWEKEHSFLFSNPDLPADATRVRLNTSKGPIVVGLYVDRAPKHAENFLQLCRAGYYDGTKFHRVVRGSLIQGGDPNSISGEPDTWGSGGPETTLEPEIDPQLRHFKGTLSAWKTPPGNRSHGSQFFITTADRHEMDGQYTVFGRLLEGDSVVEAIESGAVVGDRPQDPVVIQSTEIL